MNSVDGFVGRRLRQLRWVCGLTKADLAAHLAVSPEQVEAFERGTQRIGAGQLVALADRMNLPVSVFYHGIGMAPVGDSAGFAPPRSRPRAPASDRPVKLTLVASNPRMELASRRSTRPADSPPSAEVHEG